MSRGPVSHASPPSPPGSSSQRCARPPAARRLVLSPSAAQQLQERGVRGRGSPACCPAGLWGPWGWLGRALPGEGGRGFSCPLRTHVCGQGKGVTERGPGDRTLQQAAEEGSVTSWRRRANSRWTSCPLWEFIKSAAVTCGFSRTSKDKGGAGRGCRVSPSVFPLSDRAAREHTGKVLAKRAEEICLIQRSRLLVRKTRLRSFSIILWSGRCFPPWLSSCISLGFSPADERRGCGWRQHCRERRCPGPALLSGSVQRGLAARQPPPSALTAASFLLRGAFCPGSAISNRGAEVGVT